MVSAYKHDFGQRITTDTEGVAVDRAFLAHINIPKAAAAKADGVVKAAVGPSGAEAVALGVTEFLSQPAWPRNITVKVSATTPADVAAGNIVVKGKNIAGEEITENFAIVADTPATKTGTFAFAEITSVTIPVQDGDSVTVDVGWGDIFGIPYKLYADELVILKLFDKAVDTATVVADVTDIEKNTVDMNGTPDGLKDIDLYLLV